MNTTVRSPIAIAEFDSTAAFLAKKPTRYMPCRLRVLPMKRFSNLN